MLPLLRAMLVLFLCCFVVQIYNVSILTPRVADFVDLVDFVYLDSEIASGGLSMDATETAPIIYIGDYVIVRSSSGDYFGGVRNATEYFQWFPYTAGEGTLNTVNTVLDVQHWVRYSAESLAAMSADFIAAGSRNSDYGGRHKGQYCVDCVGSSGAGVVRTEVAVYASTGGTGNGPGATHGGETFGTFCHDSSAANSVNSIGTSGVHVGGKGAGRADCECSRGTRSAILSRGHGGTQLGVGGWRLQSMGDDREGPTQRVGAAAILLYGPLNGVSWPMACDSHGELVCGSASREMVSQLPTCEQGAAVVQFSKGQAIGAEMVLRDTQPSGRNGAPGARV